MKLTSIVAANAMPVIPVRIVQSQVIAKVAFALVVLVELRLVMMAF